MGSRVIDPSDVAEPRPVPVSTIDAPSTTDVGRATDSDPEDA